MHIRRPFVEELTFPPEIELTIWNETHVLQLILDHPRLLRYLLRRARALEPPHNLFYFTHWTIDPKGLFVDSEWTWEEFERFIQERIEKRGQPITPIS